MKNLFRRLKATLIGTFVTDCPLCHKHFYGNSNHAHQIAVNGKNYRIICGTCYNNYKPKGE